jgi:hypothetical protein
MKQGWVTVSKRFPCPICEHPDWCMIGERFVLCNRVESKLPSPGGGWLHPIGEDKPVAKPKPPPVPPVPTALPVGKLMRQWSLETMADELWSLADGLGVSLPSLEALGAAYATPYAAWAFPMRDGYSEPVGIRLRATDGRKWAVKGSKAGLFIPMTGNVASCLYVTEGPTDTAAALTLGLYAVGRPSCNSGGPEIKTFAKAHSVREIVVVADNDKPGLDGASKVAKEIGLPARIWIPPCKDIREFLNSGGTAALIESDLKNVVRRKL